jgi:outer membrane lipoprotein-sorting protein
MTNSNSFLRRAAVLAVVLLATLPAAAPPRAAAQTTDEILAKVFAARGGIDKIKAIQRQRVTGRISFGPGIEGPFIVEFARPGKMHMEIVVNGQTIVRVYDGKSGWVLNPLAPNKDVQPMGADDLRNISDEADFDGPLIDYQSKGNHVELAGKDEVDGKQTYKLQLTNKNGDVRTYFFDASTFLPIKWQGKRTAENQEISIETFFSDYREVNGLKFAFEIDSDSPGSAQQQKITIDKIEIDPQLGGATFAKPVAPAEPPPAPTPPNPEPPPAPPQR